MESWSLGLSRNSWHGMLFTMFRVFLMRHRQLWPPEIRKDGFCFWVHLLIFILEKLNVRETSLCSAPLAVRIHGSKMALSGVAVIYISWGSGVLHIKMTKAFITHWVVFFLSLLFNLTCLHFYILYTVTLLLLFWWHQQKGSWQEEMTNCRNAITSAFKTSCVVLRDRLHPGFPWISVEKLYSCMLSPPPCKVSQIIDVLWTVAEGTGIVECGEEEAQGGPCCPLQ